MTTTSIEESEAAACSAPRSISSSPCSLAWSSAGAELATPLRPALPPLLALLLAGAVAVALIVAWLARTVRAQALDAEYREEVR